MPGDLSSTKALGWPRCRFDGSRYLTEAEVRDLAPEHPWIVEFRPPPEHWVVAADVVISRVPVGPQDDDRSLADIYAPVAAFRPHDVRVALDGRPRGFWRTPASVLPAGTKLRFVSTEEQAANARSRLKAMRLPARDVYDSVYLRVQKTARRSSASLPRVGPGLDGRLEIDGEWSLGGVLPMDRHYPNGDHAPIIDPLRLAIAAVVVPADHPFARSRRAARRFVERLAEVAEARPMPPRPIRAITGPTFDDTAWIGSTIETPCEIGWDSAGARYGLQHTGNPCVCSVLCTGLADAVGGMSNGEWFACGAHYAWMDADGWLRGGAYGSHMARDANGVWRRVHQSWTVGDAVPAPARSSTGSGPGEPVVPLEDGLGL